MTSTTHMPKRTTIKDVASAAGMSLGTVSGVLNNGGNFTDETRKKVWEIANNLNYSPNARARGLRSGSAEQTRCKSGIIIHITHMGQENPIGNEFEALRSSMLAWNAEKMGMFPITYWYYKLKGFQCPPVLNGHIDGAIVGTPHPEVVNILREKIPMVLMDVPFSGNHSEVPMVNLDSRYGFTELFALLKARGHRRIGTISAVGNGEELLNETIYANDLKMAAVFSGIDVHPDCNLVVNVSPETHEAKMAEAAEHFLKYIKSGEISAIVCPTMSYSGSLYRKFSALGLSIPEDVSLTGMEFGYAAPQHDVTSVTYNWQGLIDTSLEVLKSLIDGKKLSCREFLVKPGFHPGSTVKNLTTR